MVWWEAVLSPALQVLFDKLAAGDIMEFLRKWNINEKLIEKLKIAYFTSSAVIDDAEAKQQDNPAVEAWLDMLKTAVYEAEDVLDELATEAQTMKLQSSQSMSNQVRNWNFVSSLNPFSEGVESRIESLVDKLEYIASQKDCLGLKGDAGGKFKVTRRVPTTPFVDNSRVYGRDRDLEEIVNLLVNDVARKKQDSNSKMERTNAERTPKAICSTDDEKIKGEICVVPIWGMGGIGKTTLAQCVFNDKRVDDCFSVKAWACVSGDFDVINITKVILESATGKQWGSLNLEFLQGNLRKHVSRKKFLVVLDDVWNENYDNWNDLLIPFLDGADGSRIIVTTRNEGVIQILNSIQSHQLKELSCNASWSIFLGHAFGNANPDDYPELKLIGREILNKCKGLPLAAKCMGGLLRYKLETNYWSKIMNSNLWEIPSSKCNILPALMLSYYHLPTNLKQCFAYCAIFPKDYEFDSKQLVMLWMAEGFVQQAEESQTMEEVGEEYFNELLSRSFFQRSSSNISKYVMHDLINDLAQFVSKKTCIRLEDQLKNHKPFKPPERVHHFSFIRGKYDAFMKFEALDELKQLRTFLSLEPVSGTGFCYLSKKVSNNLLPKLRCLRVLSLRSYCITEIPDSIGNLKRLRYFDLSHTAIKGLPSSICSLYNLQTLLLNDSDSLAELPADLGNLVNLLYLDISGSGLQEMPLRINELKSLRSLPEFIIGADVGARISDLRDLQHVQGKLIISKLENVIDAWDARRASIADKERLHELVMAWSADFDELRNEGVETKVLEMLQPQQKIEKIAIRNYGGTKFPTWFGDSSFSSLVVIECSDCRNCTTLPPLGQLPSLKKLYIKGLTGVRFIGAEFFGKISLPKPFPYLETLHFERMLEWENWSSSLGERDIEGFPCLHELYIENCPKLLRELPNHIPSLTTLQIRKMEKLQSPLPVIATLQELNLQGCDEVVLGAASGLTSLISLSICDIFNLKHLPSRLMQQLNDLKSLQILDCPDLVCLWKDDVRPHHLLSLQRLVVCNCPSLVTMLEEEERLPIKLEYLKVEYCHSLERMPKAMNLLSSLGELTIKDCPRLVSFASTNFPSVLRGLAIRKCSFESLPREMIHNVDLPLKYLYISGCYNFTSFSSDNDLSPTTIQQLTVDHCPNLESLPLGILHRDNLSLKVLEIFYCSSLSSFPKGKLPSTLKTLTIWHCSNLESLADVSMQDNMSLESFRIGSCTSLKFLPSGLHKLAYLDYLEIDGCPGLVVFPDGGFPTTSLKKVYIIDCENLKSLPDHMQNITSLQELHISNCPALESFPEGGLPINLTSLEIKNCENMSPLSEWGLHRLTCLKRLSINKGCSDLSSFPEWLLPPTLVSLHIASLSNLEYLSNWLQNLTSLEDLKLKECPKLQSLPVDGLPATLSRLEISDCPALEQQCEKDWDKIDHIPCILM